MVAEPVEVTGKDLGQAASDKKDSATYASRPIRVNGGLGHIHSAYRREFCVVDLLCVKAKVKKALTTYALSVPYPGEW